MKFKIDFEVKPSLKKINHKSKTVFLGSCFSDEIAKKFSEGALDVSSNPFGTLFHPIAIANLFDEIDIESTCFQQEDVWFSWLSSGLIYAMRKQDLVHKIVSLKEELFKSIQQADFLFLTLGTSIGYRLKSNNQLVANCHKVHNNQFIKELTGVDEMVVVWKKLIEKIKLINPNIQIVFTVSPVRHIKDGVHENNVSKAHLFSLIHQLNGAYFPSYEIVNDELRDYRFYKDDLVHPNEIAIDFVWNKFKGVYFDVSTNLLIDEVVQVRRMIEHTIFYPESLASLKFQNKLIQKKTELNRKVPNIKW